MSPNNTDKYSPGLASTAKTSELMFADQTLQAGVTFTHQQGDEHLSGINETLGSGVCAFDFNNDGWVDLLLINGSGQTRYYGRQHWWQKMHGHALLLNTGNGSFKDVTEAAGLTRMSWGMGCITGDMDNDGYVDVFITNNGYNTLYKNNGNGTFTDVTASSGISGNEWSTSAAIADYDNDGLLDLYVVNFIKFNKTNLTYEKDTLFSHESSLFFDSKNFDPAPNKLYRNLGNFKFEDVTNIAQVANQDGRGLDAMWMDLDDNHFPDLIVTNAAGSGPSTIYFNTGTGLFRERTTATGFHSAAGYSGLSAADVDNDGDLDIAVATDISQPPLLFSFNRKALEAGSNSSKPLFIDISKPYELNNAYSYGYMGWTPGLVDFNNDGLVDLFITNGMLITDPDAKRLPNGQKNQFWLNTGSGYFHQSAATAQSPLLDRQSSRGAAFADFDNDGDIDVYVANNNNLGQLLINNTSKDMNWLGLSLKGSTSNKDAVGARVRLTANGKRYVQTITTGNGFLSDSDRRLIFGLGASKTVQAIEVWWPDGSREEYHPTEINQYLTLEQGHQGLSSARYTQAKSIEHARSMALPPFSLSFKRTENKATVIKWIIDTKGFQYALPLLDDAIKSDNVILRLSIAKLLGGYSNSDSTRILVSLLDDQDSNVVIASINSLRSFEREQTARWLLRMFSHPNPGVKIAVANCFAFYFDEEEAMVVHKYLALPPLIRLLTDESPAVRKAAANALGRSERYRAYGPLLNAVNDKSIEVRNEVLLALGRVRERKAVPVLTAVAEDELQPSSSRAYALIALKQLDYTDTESLLLNLFSEITVTDKNAKREDSNLEVIATILDDKEGGTAFDRNFLLHIAMKLTRQPREGIRLKAYSVVFKHSSHPPVELVTRALQDKSVKIQIEALKYLANSTYKMKAKNLSVLLDKPTLSNYVINVLARYSTDDVTKKLFKIATNQNANEKDRVAAFRALLVGNRKLPAVKFAPYLKETPEITSLALQYLAKTDHPNTINIQNIISQSLESKSRLIQSAAIDVLYGFNERWATDKLREILHNESEQIHIRRLVVDKLKTDNNRDINWLFQIASKKDNALRAMSLKKLSDIKIKPIAGSLWSTLKDETSDDYIRFLCAELLYKYNNNKVVEYLLRNTT